MIDWMRIHPKRALCAGRDWPADHNWAPPGWFSRELRFGSTSWLHISVLESRIRIESSVLASVKTQRGGCESALIYSDIRGDELESDRNTRGPLDPTICVSVL
jgi:hypothetical protein